MAYTDWEFQVVVEGVMDGPEVWSNTWTVLDLESRDPDAWQTACDHFRSFYNGFNGYLSDVWSISAIYTRQLSTSIRVDRSFTTLGGESGSNALPTECAIRVSLDDMQGHNGGPFLSGFTTSALAGDGTVLAGAQDGIAGAAEEFYVDLPSDGFQLRINRPSVASTVAANRARVGQTFDVIRRRRSAVPEDYELVTGSG